MFLEIKGELNLRIVDMSWLKDHGKSASGDPP